MGELVWKEFWTGTESDEWCHTGVCVLDSGEVVFGSPRGGELVIMGGVSATVRTVRTLFTELHGITASGDGVWIADPAVKPDPDQGYEWIPSTGRAARIDLSGAVLAELIDPFVSGATAEPWRPTSIAVVQQGELAGAVWVADGYGANLLHLFSAGGDLLRTIDGAECGTAFACPHGLVFTTDNDRPLLLVADRGNRRIVRLTPEGDVVDVIADERMRSPSCLASRDGRTVLTELDGALIEVHPDATVTTIVDRVERDENDEGWPLRDGWPNIRVDGQLVRPPLLSGELNSPHGVAIGHEGEIYVTEWVIGGRFLTIR